MVRYSLIFFAFEWVRGGNCKMESRSRPSKSNIKSTQEEARESEEENQDEDMDEKLDETESSGKDTSSTKMPPPLLERNRNSSARKKLKSSTIDDVNHSAYKYFEAKQQMIER
ncbi:unnamed protein product [Acanthoscelides obtectus]|uniref:Uncharacterized protein n=1 Tax=Acanthoscelides obtectus TaxID=200917 RepID=A0A9P0K5P5_ACAOB|nr:unnamed protein product [Acanthoscelides obtectus]CAK1632618.1 hypothetical protein AOBTE_LOCUS7649 [Acanthoscelides obtectus]